MPQTRLLAGDGQGACMAGRQIRILVVEDDESGRDILGTSLREAGYEVSVASDGLEALAVLQTATFHAVLTDYRMPRVNGLEFLRMVRKRWPALPVIMLSAGPDDLRSSAIRQGARAWVSKPYEFKHVIGLVHQVTGCGRNNAAGRQDLRSGESPNPPRETDQDAEVTTPDESSRPSSLGSPVLPGHGEPWDTA